MQQRSNKIVLIGMPGSGKTTIGRIVSKKLNIDFIDLDLYIEERAQMTITDMFKIGEDYFRKQETASIYELVGREQYVLSTGGGVVKNSENMDLLRSDSVILFINRPIERILEDINNDKRPLLKDNPGKLYDLYKERYELYKKYCHYEVLNDGGAAEGAGKVLQVVEGLN